MSRFRSVDAPYLAEPEWRVADAVLAIVAGFVAVYLIGGAWLATRPNEPSTLAVLMVTFPIQVVATLLTVAALGRARGGGSFPAKVGLVARIRDVPWLGAGLVLQVVVAVLVGGLLELLPGEPTTQAVADTVSDADGAGTLVALVVLIGLAAPIAEEVVYRGVLLAALRRSMRPWPAILVSAALFALVHLLDPNALYAVPGLFLIGVALGWAALATGDLGLPMAIHAGVNLTGVVGLMFVDELSDVSEAVVRLVG